MARNSSEMTSSVSAELARTTSCPPAPARWRARICSRPSASLALARATAASLAMPRNITSWQTDQSSDQPPSTPSTPSCFFGTGVRIGGSPCGGAVGGGSLREGSFEGGSLRFGSFGLGSFAGGGGGSVSDTNARYPKQETLACLACLAVD